MLRGRGGGLIFTVVCAQEVRPLNFAFLANALHFYCINSNMFKSELRKQHKHFLSTSRRSQGPSPGTQHRDPAPGPSTGSKHQDLNPRLCSLPAPVSHAGRLHLGLRELERNPGSNWDTGRINFPTMTCMEPRAGAK